MKALLLLFALTALLALSSVEKAVFCATLFGEDSSNKPEERGDWKRHFCLLLT